MSATPRCRVLVVEDQALIAMLVEDMIHEFGSEVVGPASHFGEALRLAQTAELDAAILDINVGGEVIFPVADVLQERNIPFIFATGYGSKVLPPQFSNRTALPKPFSYQTLAEALRIMLAAQPCYNEAA